VGSAPNSTHHQQIKSYHSKEIHFFAAGQASDLGLLKDDESDL
jgi:hypothetical protein